jgi:hypothetical protein
MNYTQPAEQAAVLDFVIRQFAVIGIASFTVARVRGLV